jgi:hypothetical protein
MKKDEHDMVTDVQVASHELVDFLNRSVHDVIQTTGKHMRTRHNTVPQSPVNTERVQRKIGQTIKRVMTANKQSAVKEDDIIDFLATSSQDKVRVKQVIFDAIADDGVDERAMYSAMVLVLVGLESFLKFNHCKNKCYKALQL